MNAPGASTATQTTAGNVESVLFYGNKEFDYWHDIKRSFIELGYFDFVSYCVSRRIGFRL